MYIIYNLYRKRCEKMAKFCISCGSELPENAVACPNCGAMQNANQAQVQPQPQQVVVNNVQAQNKSNAFAGFGVSLVSTLLCCGSFNVISLVLSIVGVAKAKDYGGNGKGLAIAGIIISAIGLILLILLTALGVVADFTESVNSRTY